jgi:formylglycine-generating enzyme required for sulfatase activity
LLLGELGDNLRYEYVAGAVQGWSNWPIAGLRLKQPHWLCCGRPGSDERTTYRIGSDSGGEAAEFPSWPVALKPFQAARYAVTVQEWQHFMESGGYKKHAPWWENAGEAAQLWLRGNGVRRRQPWFWDEPRNSNPLQPVMGINAFEALAYAAWADGLDALAWQKQGGGEGKRQSVAVPTEVLWEAAVQGQDLSGAPRAAGCAHGSGTQEPGALDFNHGWHLRRIAPVGSYSLGATPAGLFDAAGNIWEWCSNEVSDEQFKAGWGKERWRRLAQEPAEPYDSHGSRALRGGAFDSEAARCRASYRSRHHPDVHGDALVGVRLVRVWPPHSEP